MLEKALEHDGRFQGPHIADDANLRKILFQERTQFDSIGNRRRENTEFKFEQLAVDCLVANSVVDVVLPAGGIEKLFGLVEVLLVKWQGLFWRHPGSGMKDTIGLVVQAVK